MATKSLKSGFINFTNTPQSQWGQHTDGRPVVLAAYHLGALDLSHDASGQGSNTKHFLFGKSWPAYCRKPTRKPYISSRTWLVSSAKQCLPRS